MLRALQTERDSVNELENALSILQQNNSAISEMVHSRDTLIEELNNRVAVFEEDKLVLKAALRQLQKEMKEEGPKTQKIIDDLKNTRAEVERLNSELTRLITAHKSEVTTLEGIITQKQAYINSSESNMTVIGSYVDKLEERLATFAIARRDIDIREQKCQEIEQRAILLEKECSELREKMSMYDVDHDELKSLLADLVDERAELQRENAALKKEKSNLVFEGSMLRDTISSLEIDVDSLGQHVSVWKTKVADLEGVIENQSTDLRRSEEEGKQLSMALEEKATQVENLLQQRMYVEEMETSRMQSAVEVEQLRQQESENDDQGTELLHLEDDIPPPPPPPPPPEKSETSMLSDVDDGSSLEAIEFDSDSNGSFDGQLPTDADQELSVEEWSLEDESPGGSEQFFDAPVQAEVGYRGQRRDVQDLSDRSATLDGVENPTPGQSKEETLDEQDADQRWDEGDPSGDVANQLPDPSEVEENLHEVEHNGDPEGISEPERSDPVPSPSDVAISEPQDSTPFLELPSEESKPQSTTEDKLAVDTDCANVSTPEIPRRKVPFRAIRKAFSRTTGIHGLVTPSSMPYPTKRDKGSIKPK